MISGKLGLVDTDTPDGADWTMMQAQARLEHRFSEKPFGIGANYLYTVWDEDHNEQVVSLFARMYFGSKTLFENDRTGNSMDSLAEPLARN